ncbi:polar amino acid transport system substrate-binding protein [Inhella inkyongensis]|uniref:Polar amino acid transport system substrate-binding protein n=1 Tax=Inhella inkyongensis TaxID=392593 RepID=A0A840S644_9BURK|nr:transporter substrate-binding domain-containing protein [Inhella inkyongensis]MBB5204264.1 polar amino acid transport system substrate-binding protein [Inhella inkyongensis]
MSVEAAQPLPLRFDAGNPPFMSEQQGVAVGFYPLLLEAAARRAGVAVELRAMPWVRVVREVDDGLSCAVGVYSTPARRSRWAFSEPFFKDQILVLGLPGRELPPVREVKDLVGLRVGVVRGWAYGELQEKVERLDRLESTYDDQLFQSLQAGKSDVVLALQHAAQHTLERLGMEARILAVLAEQDVHIACPKRAPFVPQMQRLSQVLRVWKRDGTMARMAGQSLGPAVKPSR